jgi:hypothetical protein
MAKPDRFNPQGKGQIRPVTKSIRCTSCVMGRKKDGKACGACGGRGHRIV